MHSEADGEEAALLLLRGLIADCLSAAAAADASEFAAQGAFEIGLGFRV